MEKLLGNLKKGLLFIVSSPSGAGKTTLSEMLCKEFDCVVRSISCTTRAPRTGEKDKVDYFFITKEEFEQKITENAFLEYAQVFDHYYGTLKKHVTDLRQKGKHVLLVIDVQGSMQVKEKTTAISIFVSPPSLEELKSRLIKRQTEDQVQIEKRLQRVQEEMSKASSYDYHIVNDNLEVAYATLRDILISEEQKAIKE